MSYNDGTFTSVKQMGLTRISYPFINAPTKDSTTKVYETDWAILPGSWTPAAALMTFPGDGTFGADTAAYLVQEAPPQDAGGFYKLTRRWSKVPGAQVNYPAAIYITLPKLTDFAAISRSSKSVNAATGLVTGLSQGYVHRTSAGVLYLWLSNNKFFGPATVVTPALTPATGGTFTITYGASTTAAISYAETNATIDAAINALASVISEGFTVTCSNVLNQTSAFLQITTSVKAANMFTMSSSLTPAAASTVHTWWSGSTSQYMRIDLRAAITSHGISTANPLGVAYSTDLFELPPEQFSTPDANTIAFATGPIFGNTTPVPIGQAIIGGYKRAYTPATRLIGTKQTDSFYLPTVTAGITTPADIPRPAGMQSDQTLLDAVLTTSGFQTYRSEGPSVWQGPIYSQSVVEINVDDIT